MSSGDNREPAWDERGLAPAIAQEARTGRVLMLAWMNAEALRLTLETGWATYWSRSRQGLWVKGETSGHRQRVIDVRLDCDHDAILVQVEQTGPACHTGEPSCFYRAAGEGGTLRDTGPPPGGMIERLQGVLEERRHADPDRSYTARLLARGMPKILEKVNEEAAELAQALDAESDERVVSEAADVVYHVLVGFAARGIDATRVAQELARRFGTSGLVEKASRGDGE